jgi:hypothetical protein
MVLVLWKMVTTVIYIYIYIYYHRRGSLIFVSEKKKQSWNKNRDSLISLVPRQRLDHSYIYIYIYYRRRGSIIFVSEKKKAIME